MYIFYAVKRFFYYGKIFFARTNKEYGVIKKQSSFELKFKDQIDQLTKLNKNKKSHSNDLFNVSLIMDFVRNVDLVNFNSCKLFLPKNDNLYDSFCNKQNSTTDLNEPNNTKTISHLLNELIFFLAFKISDKKSVGFIDGGAWVGDVAIQSAAFCKKNQIEFHAHCYDPSFAGCLIPYNISLNQLDSFVTFFPLAISFSNINYLFHQKPGFSDAAHIEENANESEPVVHYVVESTTLPTCLQKLSITDYLIVKLDLEGGLDLKIFISNDSLCVNHILITEFSINPDQSVNREFLKLFLTTHRLFDIGYLPNPFCFNEVTSNEIDSFIHTVNKRLFKYTDLVLLPKNLNNLDKLIQHLSSLKIPTENFQYVLN